MLEERIALRDLLLGGLGTELPIRGGYGCSREDAIIITKPDADGVALTRVRTMQALGKGRGVFWRTIANALLGDQWPGIEQFKIETVRLTETQIITRTENFYFDVSEMMTAQRRWQSPPVIVHQDISGLVFPFEIGWLHFDKSENNELDAPGLGHSLNYKAPGVACSVCVYDRGLANIPDDVAGAVVQNEFEKALRDIDAHRPDLAACSDQPPRQDCLERYYRVGDAGHQASLLCLTTSRRRFIKLRVTWVRDQFIDEAAMTFVDTVLTYIRQSGPLPTIRTH
jgi:hypothetical protein